MKLWFGPRKDTNVRCHVFTMKQIAYILNAPLHKVSSTVWKFKHPKMRNQVQRSVSAHTLEPEHEAFLTDVKTLRSWISFSLQRRAKLFHRRFPDKVTSASAICKLYKRKKIVFKKVKYSPYISATKQTRINLQLFEALTELLTACDVGANVIFIDEVTFSSHTRQGYTFAPRNQQMVIHKKKLWFPVVAAVGAINQYGELLQVSTFEHSVDRPKFLQFLEALATKTQLREATMLIDNLSLHHSNVVKEWAENAGLRLLFNAPYSSQYNPIEQLWGLAKRNFYRDEMVVEKEMKYCDVETNVIKYISEVPQEKIMNSVNHVLKYCRSYVDSSDETKLREECALLDAVH